MTYKNTMPGGGTDASPATPRGETGSPVENSAGKKGGVDAGVVWLEALGEFEGELHEHVEQPGADLLRFQTGRLYASLVRRIKANSSGKGEWALMFACYEFMTDAKRHVVYEEAKRLHGEEMRWLEKSTARKFCSSLPRVFSQAPERMLKELELRVCSMAGWVECQESFAMWLVFRDFRSGWRGTNMEKRARAVVAINLSRMHKDPERVRVRTRYKGKPWSDVQWVKILRQAANLTEKRFDCTQFDRWLWWVYPVARRYSWNTRELQDVAYARGFVQAREMYEENFRRHMMTMGLRLSGRKKARGSVPLLREFILRMVLPDEKAMWGEVGGLLTARGCAT